MKNKFFASAVALIVVCSISHMTGNAQSIVGKWKMVSATETVTDKATGKKQDLTPQTKEIVKMMEQIIEFKADNTYFTSNTITGNKKGFEGTGTYSLAGKEIKLKEQTSNVPPVTDSKKPNNPMSKKWPETMTIVSQTANTLVLHYSAETQAGGKTMIVDIEDTFQKE